jgi:hypothetical protein
LGWIQGWPLRLITVTEGFVVQPSVFPFDYIRVPSVPTDAGRENIRVSSFVHNSTPADDSRLLRAYHFLHLLHQPYHLSLPSPILLLEKEKRKRKIEIQL